MAVSNTTTWAFALALVLFVQASTCDARLRSKDLLARLDSLDSRLDDIYIGMIKESPEVQINSINLDLVEIQEKLARKSFSSRIFNKLCKACTGGSEEKELKHDLAMQYLYKTIALQALGDHVGAFIELKKAQKLSKHYASKRLEDLSRLETELKDQITNLLDEHPKALFGYKDEDEYYKFRLDMKRMEVNEKIDTLNRPKDEALEYVRDLFNRAYTKAARQAIKDW